jgi:hypothetical protein
MRRRADPDHPDEAVRTAQLSSGIPEDPDSDRQMKSLRGMPSDAAQSITAAGSVGGRRWSFV